MMEMIQLLNSSNLSNLILVTLVLGIFTTKPEISQDLFFTLLVTTSFAITLKLISYILPDPYGILKGNGAYLFPSLTLANGIAFALTLLKYDHRKLLFVLLGGLLTFVALGKQFSTISAGYIGSFSHTTAGCLVGFAGFVVKDLLD